MGAKIKHEELTGVYSREIFRSESGDFLIGQLRPVRDDGTTDFVAQPVTIKGKLDEGDELLLNVQYRFFGKRTTDAKYGPQFDFATFIRPTPAGRSGITRYLQDAPNIGRAIAETLWTKFGSDAVRILREQPDIVTSTVPRLSTEKAAEAAKYLKQEHALEHCTIDLIDVLGGRGFPKNLAKQTVQLWGNKAPEIIRRNPYILMNFRGVGFMRADALYLELGLSAKKMKRQALCVWHSLASNTSGDTWFEHVTAIKALRDKISGTETNPPMACKIAKRAQYIATRRDATGKLWLAEHKKAKAEAYVAKCVAESLVQPCEAWIDVASRAFKDASEHQREKLSLLGGTLGILGGSPGTGKSWCLAAIVRHAMESMGIESIAIAAPTGKAAVRMSEAMSQLGIPTRARTIHSLLGVEGNDNRGGWSFRHNETNPLPYRLIACDEMSMCDCSLFASLLAAVPSNAKLLLIGDVNQLPPVGHGAPLRDLIAAGVQYAELREIRRNSGRIVQACAEIRDGKTFKESPAINIDGGENLKIIPTTTPAEQVAKMLSAIRVAKQTGFDPIWDCQVIVPVNKRSPLARKEMNRVLQGELNPNGEQVKGSPFRIGDKIVCTKNAQMPIAKERDLQKQVNRERFAKLFAVDNQNAARDEWDDNDDREGEAEDPEGFKGPGISKSDDSKVFVANGEQAEVIETYEKKAIARLLAPERLIIIPRGAPKDAAAKEDSVSRGDTNGEAEDNDNGNGCDFDLAYAVSCHKSQGAEYPIVIVMIDDYMGAKMLCDRSWIYTAISRAKKLCLLIGKKSTADGFCRKNQIKARKTFLVEQIAQAKIDIADKAAERLREVKASILSAAAAGNNYSETNNFPRLAVNISGELVSI